MRILIFGGNGMAGHMLTDYFARKQHEVVFTQRNASPDPRGVVLDVMELTKVERLLKQFKPELVINAAGILNDETVRRQREAIYVNSYFPHQASLYGKQLGFRFIHISTDCVFSGEAGSYKESDAPDGRTMYAVTKWMGEVIDPAHVTIRTSIIGPELKDAGIGLFHWFMCQTGEIKGYRQAFWSGVTTLELAKAIEWIMERPIGGLLHLTVPEKISKYRLLVEMKEVFGRDDLKITPDDRYKADKSLVNTRPDFTYPVASYRTMLEELMIWMKSGERKYPY